MPRNFGETPTRAANAAERQDNEAWNRYLSSVQLARQAEAARNQDQWQQWNADQSVSARNNALALQLEALDQEYQNNEIRNALYGQQLRSEARRTAIAERAPQETLASQLLLLREQDKLNRAAREEEQLRTREMGEASIFNAAEDLAKLRNLQQENANRKSSLVRLQLTAPQSEAGTFGWLTGGADKEKQFVDFTTGTLDRFGYKDIASTVKDYATAVAAIKSVAQQMEEERKNLDAQLLMAQKQSGAASYVSQGPDRTWRSVFRPSTKNRFIITPPTNFGTVEDFNQAKGYYNYLPGQLINVGGKTFPIEQAQVPVLQ